MASSDQVAVFVDAGYLFKAGGQALASRPVRREETQLDAHRAVDAMRSEAATRAPRVRLLRIYWYDGSRGTLAGSQLDLARLDDVKLRLGTLNSAGEQKQVDSLIITDMMSLAQKGAVSDVVLISGDADIIVGLQFAQEFGVRVHLRTIAPTRGNTSADLRYAVDTQAEWVASDLSAFLRFAPRTAQSDPAGPSVSAVPRGADHATIVARLLETATQEELLEIASGQPGLVPGSLDHRLLGVARAANGGAMLGEPEKRALRKMLYEAAMRRFAAERGGA